MRNRMAVVRQAETSRVAAAAGDVRLSLLDGFAVSCGGRAVELPLTAQRLVAFLALRERPANRVFVAGSLWVSSSEERAAAALRTTLWRTARAVRSLVCSRGAALGLGDDVEVDVRDAQRCGDALLHAAPGEPEADATLLLRHGDLLPDWYDDWVLLERERIRQIRLQALEALARRELQRGSFATAAEAGLAAVCGEPLRESSHRVVVRIHLAQGNPGEALRQYELFRGLLAGQLGLAPSAAMEELVARARVAVMDR